MTEKQKEYFNALFALIEDQGSEELKEKAKPVYEKIMNSDVDEKECKVSKLTIVLSAAAAALSITALILKFV